MLLHITKTGPKSSFLPPLSMVASAVFAGQCLSAISRKKNFLYIVYKFFSYNDSSKIHVEKEYEIFSAKRCKRLDIKRLNNSLQCSKMAIYTTTTKLKQ